MQNIFDQYFHMTPLKSELNRVSNILAIKKAGLFPFHDYSNTAVYTNSQKDVILPCRKLAGGKHKMKQEGFQVEGKPPSCQ